MKRKITDKNLIASLNKLGHLNKGPQPLFKQQARERLMDKISPQKRALILPAINLHPLIWKRLTAVSFKYGLSAFLGFMLLGAGTVLAAQSSLPTSPLYPVKRATEQVALTVSKIFSQQTQMEQKIANERFKEIQQLEKFIKETTKEYRGAVDRLKKADPKFKKENLQQVIQKETVLENIKEDKQDENKASNQDNNSRNTPDIDNKKTQEDQSPREKKQDNLQQQNNQNSEGKSPKDRKK